MRDESRGPRSIGLLAASLFIGGLLLPFALYPILVSGIFELSHQRAVNISAAVGAVCEVLALVLGLVGWRHPNGKIAAIGSGVLIALALLATLAFILR